MLDGLDQVEWANLWACGWATEIPQSLRALASPDRAVRKQVLAALHHRLVVYQGGSIMEATPYSVPFLLELLMAPVVEEKADLLWLLADIARGQPFILGTLALDGYEDEASAPPDLQAELAEQRGWVERAREAVEQGVPIYVTLLAHPEAQTRMFAAALLAIFPTHALASVPALQASLAQEVDELVQADLVLSLGTLLEPETAALQFLYPYIEADCPPLLRFVAAIAIARRARAETPAEVVKILLAALAAAETLAPSYEHLAAVLLRPYYSFPANLSETLAQVGPSQAVPALNTVLHGLFTQGGAHAAQDCYDGLPVAGSLLAAAFSHGEPRPAQPGMPYLLRQQYIEVFNQQVRKVLPHEVIDVEATLGAARGLLAPAFAQDSPLSAAPLARPGAPALTPGQQMALTALVNEDAFWNLDRDSGVWEPGWPWTTEWHELLTAYGLPASRHTLRQLIELRGVSPAEPLAPTLTVKQHQVVAAFGTLDYLLAHGNDELRLQTEALLMEYGLPTSRAALRDLLLG